MEDGQLRRGHAHCADGGVMRKRLVTYIRRQLDEASTWRGLVVIATAFGMHLSPDQADAVVAVGLGLSGLLGVMLPDRVRR